ncbi:MAG: hypothetical protein KC493_11385 [Bacteriovoracaceae bacterium]|nr:hypothetical protein [Bacteriovoracaceae bacterium]
MKTLLAATIIVLSFVFATGAQAGDDLKKTKKVSVEKAAKTSKKVKGFETYRGEKFSLNKVRGRSHSIVEVLKRHQIEMISGEIVYPEEVEFVLVPSNVRAPKSRAPHTDDGSGPNVGRAPKSDD